MGETIQKGAGEPFTTQNLGPLVEGLISYEGFIYFNDYENEIDETINENQYLLFKDGILIIEIKNIDVFSNIIDISRIKNYQENKTVGKEKRLKFLCGELGIEYPPPLKARYQLLHRTVSAILEAKRFRANEAVMVIHTFSKTNEWFEDFQYFLSLFGLEAGINQAVTVKILNEINLSFARVHGSEKYLKL